MRIVFGQNVFNYSCVVWTVDGGNLQRPGCGSFDSWFRWLAIEPLVWLVVRGTFVCGLFTVSPGISWANQGQIHHACYVGKELCSVACCIENCFTPSALISCPNRSDSLEHFNWPSEMLLPTAYYFYKISSDSDKKVFERWSGTVEKFAGTHFFLLPTLIQALQFQLDLQALV